MASTLHSLRTTLVRLTRSRVALIAASAVVVLAVAGTALGYSTLSTTVALTVDGETRQVSAMADTVGDVLEAEGLEVGEHDVVAPGVEEKIDDGSRISVKYGRPLTLSVDGEERTYWVTATDVDDALDEIGRPFAAARLSTSRSSGISREGMALTVVTPKKVTLALAGRKPVSRKVTAVTVGEALDRLKVEVDEHDTVKPGLDHQLEDGDRIVYTDVRRATKRVAGEKIGFDTVEREDDSMLEGDDEVVREGRAGARDVVYRLTYRNGELVERAVVRQRVTTEPVDRVVRVGTKEPEVSARSDSSAPNYAAGNSVWDRLAQCESGGNWATNTGNGYYGGLQFSASTWASVGGSGLPHQHSREEQIKRGQILQSRAGWGQWPHCTSKLGLR